MFGRENHKKPNAIFSAFFNQRSNLVSCVKFQCFEIIQCSHWNCIFLWQAGQAYNTSLVCKASDFFNYRPAHPLSFKISSPIISSLHVNITLLQDIKLKAPGRKALQMEFLPSPRFPLLENWLPIHARSRSQCGESGDNCSWFNY